MLLTYYDLSHPNVDLRDKADEPQTGAQNEV